MALPCQCFQDKPGGIRLKLRTPKRRRRRPAPPSFWRSKFQPASLLTVPEFNLTFGARLGGGPGWHCRVTVSSMRMSGGEIEPTTAFMKIWPSADHFRSSSAYLPRPRLYCMLRMLRACCRSCAQYMYPLLPRSRKPSVPCSRENTPGCKKQEGLPKTSTS